MTNTVKALFFDVFGTLVDWRSGVAREVADVLMPRGHAIDFLAFADAWRAEYQAGMEPIRTGKLPFEKLDDIHRRNLERHLPRFGLQDLDDATLSALTLAWHRLDAWPDVAPGLARLGRRFLLAPVSNGHISLIAALARRNDMRWDAVLGAEIARDYKPKPAVYLTAAAAFDLAPGACMMVAAHTADLVAAAACGLKTAHVARPHEQGPGRGEAAPTAPVDFAVRGLLDLAARMGT